MKVKIKNINVEVDVNELLKSMTYGQKYDLLKELFNDAIIDSKMVARAIDESLLDADGIVDELIELGVIDNKREIATCVEIYGVDYDSKADDVHFVGDVLEAMPKYDLKRALCNALFVGSYTNESKLRENLEAVITAK